MFYDITDITVVYYHLVLRIVREEHAGYVFYCYCHGVY